MTCEGVGKTNDVRNAKGGSHVDMNRRQPFVDEGYNLYTIYRSRRVRIPKEPGFKFCL